MYLAGKPTEVASLAFSGFEDGLRDGEWVTSIHTLQPGDILATGTNIRTTSLVVLAD
jgi:hypothetical protein